MQAVAVMREEEEDRHLYYQGSRPPCRPIQPAAAQP